MPNDLILWICLPTLAMLLVFTWLVLLVTHKRQFTVGVRGLGISVTINSKEKLNDDR